ncbi:MAG TPA: hypothetical protein PK867_09525 [Pirellulales bacterium]|nr:hypothetical protein [Pirellulales bacterium]
MRQHRKTSLGDDGDGRRAAIVKNFRCAARRPWCRLVWKAAVEACGGTQDAAAQRLFVSTSAVSEGLQHGRLSIETLVMMMAELAPDGSRLPKLPPREELMEEGMIEALAFLLQPTKRAGDRRRISRDDLAALAAMLADKEWATARAEREQALRVGDDHRLCRAESKLAASAKRICGAASRRRGRPVERSAEQLGELHRTWAAAWTECSDALPFDWQSA